MRCGKCGSSGPDVSVDHVRACYQGRTTAAVQAEQLGDNVKWPLKGEDDEPMWPASDKQIKYVLGLQDERILPDNWLIYDQAALEKMERDQVSGIITMLKALPKGNHSEDQKEWTMPDGRYALLFEFGTDNNEDSVWRFYQVDRPTDGRWKGYTFLNMLIGAPGSYRKEPIRAAKERNRILADIERDPKEAMVNYGLQSGICGRCSSPLTDPDSLARGLGPVCAGKMEW